MNSKVVRTKYFTTLSAFRSPIGHRYIFPWEMPSIRYHETINSYIYCVFQCQSCLNSLVLSFTRTWKVETRNETHGLRAAWCEGATVTCSTKLKLTFLSHALLLELLKVLSSQIFLSVEVINIGYSLTFACTWRDASYSTQKHCTKTELHIAWDSTPWVPFPWEGKRSDFS